MLLTRSTYHTHSSCRLEINSSHDISSWIDRKHKSDRSQFAGSKHTTGVGIIMKDVSSHCRQAFPENLKVGNMSLTSNLSSDLFLKCRQTGVSERHSQGSVLKPEERIKQVQKYLRSHGIGMMYFLRRAAAVASFRVVGFVELQGWMWMCSAQQISMQV